MGNEDFDPFDLSAPPRVINDPKTLMVDFQPKPTVRRVSMGPIFHSRILRTIALILGIILFALSGYIGMNYYLSQKQAKDNLVKPAVSSTTTNDKSNTTDKTPSTKTPITPPADKSTNSTTPVTTPPTTPQPAKVFCGVSGMPEGVCTAITSIEKDGLKGNQYLTASAQAQANNLPNGSVVTIDKSSWTAVGSDKGTVKFSGNLNGPAYAGLGNFQLLNDKWMLTGYTLNT